MDGSSCLHKQQRFMDNSLCVSNYFHIQYRFGAAGPSPKGTQWAQAAWPLLHTACCQKAGLEVSKGAINFTRNTHTIFLFKFADALIPPCPPPPKTTTQTTTKTMTITLWQPVFSVVPSTLYKVSCSSYVFLSVNQAFPERRTGFYMIINNPLLLFSAVIDHMLLWPEHLINPKTLVLSERFWTTESFTGRNCAKKWTVKRQILCLPVSQSMVICYDCD